MTAAKEEKFVKSEFVRDAAEAYAKANKITLPKKIKDDQTLFEIVREAIIEKYDKKKIPPKERYYCETCGKIVQEPDIYCWCCGADIGDEGEGGGWPPPKEKKIHVQDKSSKDGKKGEKKDSKKPEPKPPKKAEKKPEKKPEKKTETKLAKKDDSGWKLNQYTQEIRALRGSTGAAIWQIGRRLIEVQKLKKYKEGKYQSLKEYVEAELGYKYNVARQFMKASTVVDEKVAGQVGVFTMQLFARTPQEALPKLIKGALPPPEGKGLGRTKLEELLQAERERLGKKTKAGRPKKGKKDPGKKLWGKGVFVRLESWDEGATGLAGIENTKTGVEVTIRETGVRVDVVELE